MSGLLSLLLLSNSSQPAFCALNCAPDTASVCRISHGWGLGEHGMWCKETNFHIATHAPLMISHPTLVTKPTVRRCDVG